MKNNLVTLSLFTLTMFLFSCQKETADSNYYFTANVNENWVTYNDASFYVTTDPSDPNVTRLQIYGGDKLNSIALSMQTTTAIGQGDYVSGDSLASYQFFINLFQDNGAGSTETFTSAASTTNIHPLYTLTITSYGENEIKGKITGNYLYNTVDGATMPLTEAEFVARRMY